MNTVKEQLLKDKMVKELIGRYIESWENTTTSSLIEELEILYRCGVKGFDNMDYNDILKEWQEYQDDEGDKKDYGDRI